jgi:hypothetical protein
MSDDASPPAYEVKIDGLTAEQTRDVAEFACLDPDGISFPATVDAANEAGAFNHLKTYNIRKHAIALLRFRADAIEKPDLMVLSMTGRNARFRA